ncbi:hypothetical protein BATDEDRAFT_22851 [Batrachochytrium dendrobatidis JAM81]|uniref:Uncharacterized protein n=1 Tax=Batrachochytrium dendrobatidis (strain JAM81 / FGSC 10211) TaxID=684364 RepID=F4NVZ4_BATDJ|nr:uncharacterized protein BATDEDRAFT_22851 [Batrachochytrium dendrobatidis JAM81]EGF82389.1 hypothetical protein BATDEDRAFT_22851 [Batrachochytrium dendrobatidis JAM81]|eukprot:XP_006676650.1 hypothetical protein BATDEDRAFT_22851 [Batrachochytrium dendrobatidis JAM81]
MMASELWVKLGSYNAVEVSTEGCRNVDKFLKACKRELPRLLDAYDSAQLSLSTTAGGPALRPGLLLSDILSQPGYVENTAKAPLFISVADSSAQRTTGADMNIVTNAFPPLGRRQLYSSAKSTTRQQSIYGITVQVEIGNFGILQELKLERLNKTGSLLWTEVVLSDRNTLDNWSGEIDIQTYVKNALKDCSRVCPFLKSLDVYREQTFSFAQIMDKKQGNRADAIVFVKDTAFITGVAEVKVPGSNLDDIYQIVDYMVDLRNSFNVRYVFGVYTTYEEWKILWFEDSQEAAESDSKERYDELCLAGSANEYAITEGAVKIFQSKTYRFCDPELIECLATLLYKVSMTPVYNPTKFIDDRSRYVYATATSIQYKSLPKRLEYFKYAMPPKQTRNFYILSYFHRGGDGRVVLVTSESGNLAVIKCKFSSLQTWNKISSKFNYDLLSEELEDCVNTQQLDAYQVSPLLAAKEALSTVADKLSSHMDLCFRHVALLPKRNSQTDFYDFQAILIDLTRVESELDPQVAHSRAAEGYAKLELELDQIKKAFPN